MRKFQFVFISLITLIFSHHASGAPDLWSDGNQPYPHDAFHDVYSTSGDEIPWPLIVRPYWVLLMQDNFEMYDSNVMYDDNSIEFGHHNIAENKIGDQSVGLWREIGFSDTPKTLKVSVVKEPDGSAKKKLVVTQVDSKTQKPILLGFGHFKNWIESVDTPEDHNRRASESHETDEAGYYIVFRSAKDGMPRQFVRLTEVQNFYSDEILLGVSIVGNGLEYQSNHLFRRIRVNE